VEVLGAAVKTTSTSKSKGAEEAKELEGTEAIKLSYSKGYWPLLPPILFPLLLLL
jgi:hypothetical protein